jgi:hypothetical protein
MTARATLRSSRPIDSDTPPYDADNVAGPLQEACLECLQSNPLSFVPLPHNLQHPIMALEPPLLIAE